MSTLSKCVNAHTPPEKVNGGYRPLSNQQICEAWDAYTSKALNGFLGLRVYLALHETDERRLAFNRRRNKLGLPPRLSVFDEDRLVEEVHCLVGGAGGRHIRAAFRRLKAAGLVRFSPSGIEFPSPGRSPAAGPTRVSAMLQRIDTRRSVRERVVPIPRKMLRYIARGVPSVVAATMLGHAMRCLWLNGDRICATGSCSASFVADVFDVHSRTVKRARAHLREIGWLHPIETGWRHTRCHGPRAEINLEWRDERRTTSQYVPPCNGSPPHRRPIGTESPPASTERSLLLDRDEQKPKRECRKPATPTEPPRRSATLSNVILDDLSDPFRLDELFEQAVKRGWVAASACERLHFHTAAAHALSAAGVRNPCGLFVYLVRGQRWERLTLAAEDSAGRLLKSLDEPDSANDEKSSVGLTPAESLSPPRTERTPRRCSVSQLVSFLARQKCLDAVIEQLAARTDQRLPEVRRIPHSAAFATASHCVLPGDEHFHAACCGVDPTPTHPRGGPAARDPVGRRSPRPSDSELAAAGRVGRWPGLRTGSLRPELLSVAEPCAIGFGRTPAESVGGPV